MPAGSTQLKPNNRMVALFTPTVREELARIEKDLGGRQALVGMLTLAPLTPDLRYTLGMLGDPQNDGVALAEICARGNILPGELLKQLTSAALLRGKVKAAQKIGDGIAAVAEDVMRRAAPYEDACYACNGLGFLPPVPTPQDPNPNPAPCETCKTVGRLRYSPDLARQELAIEMAQLLQKGGGINIALQQHNTAGGQSGGGGSLEQIQSLTDRLLYGSGMPNASGGPTAGEGMEGDVEEGEVVDPSGGDSSGAGSPSATEDSGGA